MAEGSEYFPIGSFVVCVTYHKKELEGEVLAFDPQTKMLILKCPSSNGKSNLCDVHMVNLNYVSDVDVKKEATTSPPPMQYLNLQRISRRLELNVDEKMRMVNAMASGVSSEGRQLFLAISKTYAEIAWQGENIIVLNQVIITPPYRPENCKSMKSDDQAVIRIRKIVEKHIKDQQLQSQESSSNPTGAVAHAQV